MKFHFPVQIYWHEGIGWQVAQSTINRPILEATVELTPRVLEIEEQLRIQHKREPLRPWEEEKP